MELKRGTSDDGDAIVFYPKLRGDGGWGSTPCISVQIDDFDKDVFDSARAVRTIEKMQILNDYLVDAGYGQSEGLDNISMDAKWRPNGTDILFDTLNYIEHGDKEKEEMVSIIVWNEQGDRILNSSKTSLSNAIFRGLVKQNE